MKKATDSSPMTQLDKFKEAARELECDDDEARFAARMRRIGLYRPKREKPDGEEK